jgi:sugar phosphate permease
MIVLGGIGFFLYGPHLMMGATIAMDLGSRKASATASGVIDALGYTGAALAGVGTSWARSLTGDWSGAFILWIGGVFVAALLMLFLWNVRPATDPDYV